MQTVGNLPPEKQRNGTSQQAIGVPAGNEYKGRKHHRKIPIVDAAGGTAPILHKPRLKRTEEQDANDIAYRICKGNQDQNASVE